MTAPTVGALFAGIGGLELEAAVGVLRALTAQNPQRAGEAHDAVQVGTWLHRELS